MPTDVQGNDTVYVGKGKWAKDVDAKKFAARDNLLTGGWAGGEVGLKLEKQLKLKAGDYVAIKNSGGLFSFLQSGDSRKTGTIKKVAVSNGKVTASVAVLPFDNVVEYNGDQLELIEK